MITVKIEPLSVNKAWKGQRFKTDAYKAFEKEVLLTLKPMKLLPPPYKVSFVFGFSSNGSDIDNPTKMCIDILSKKYRFNDNLIHELNIKKEIVKKGKEFFSFEISQL